MDAHKLAYYFVHHITKAKVGIEGRVNSAMKAIPALIERGWSIPDIKEELDQFARDYPQVVINIYHMEEIMEKKEPPNNLLEPDVFYYHGQLRSMSKPPVIKKDEETGEFVRHTEPFYLEMKKVYSMKDLMHYWYTEMNIQPNDHMRRQDEGKFNYMLGNYTIDEILFAIDVSKIIREERQLRPLRNAFELDKYIEEARDMIKRKENVHKVQGINRVFKRDGQYE